MQIIVIRFTEAFDVPLHSHDFIEINFVAEGKGFHHIGNDIYPVTKGHLFVVPVGIPHVYRPSSPDSGLHPLIVYNCLFKPQLIEKMSALLSDSSLIGHLNDLQSDTAAYYSVQDIDGSIEKLMVTMYRESSLSSIGSSTYLYTLLIQLIITVYRFKTEGSLPQTRNTANLNHLIQYLEQNLHEDITLSHLAGISQWSIRHLQRMFIQHTGQTFGNLLQNIRIQKGCEYLRDSQLKISTIAEKVGYTHIDSFNAVFKKIVGQTPSQYRKQMRDTNY